MHRVNSSFVREQVPAKIMSNYFGGRLRLDMRKAVTWTAQWAGWQTELKAALAEPTMFVAAVDRMADQIQAVS
jgi:hypothetical protein